MRREGWRFELGGVICAALCVVMVSLGFAGHVRAQTDGEAARANGRVNGGPFGGSGGTGPGASSEGARASHFELTGHQARRLAMQLKQMGEAGDGVQVESGAGSTFFSSRDISCRESKGEGPGVPPTYSCKVTIKTGDEPKPCSEKSASQATERR